MAGPAVTLVSVSVGRRNWCGFREVRGVLTDPGLSLAGSCAGNPARSSASSGGFKCVAPAAEHLPAPSPAGQALLLEEDQCSVRGARSGQAPSTEAPPSSVPSVLHPLRPPSSVPCPQSPLSSSVPTVLRPLSSTGERKLPLPARSPPPPPAWPALRPPRTAQPTCLLHGHPLPTDRTLQKSVPIPHSTATSSICHTCAPKAASRISLEEGCR